MERRSKWSKYEYALYDQEDGGILVYIGTADQCANWLGICYHSFTKAFRRGHRQTYKKRYTAEIVGEV